MSRGCRESQCRVAKVRAQLELDGKRGNMTFEWRSDRRLQARDDKQDGVADLRLFTPFTSLS
jgi:hypothetical protein